MPTGFRDRCASRAQRRADAVTVQFGVASENVLPTLRSASEQRLCVDIAYYSFGKDERTERRIEPSGFFLDQGNWYVAAHCHRAGAERIFRVDRVESAELSDEPFTREPENTGAETFAIESAQRATLRIPRDRMHLLEGLPIDSSTPEGDLEVVTLPVSSARWLQRLMIRIGPGVSLSTSNSPDLLAAFDATIERIVDRHTS